MLNATCICGNTSGYDKGSLKGSTIKVNGVKIVLDCACEDELLVKLAKRRGIGIKLGEGGDLLRVDVAGIDTRFIKLADGYTITEE